MSHPGSTALLLAGVVAVGAAPLVTLVAWAARRRSEPGRAGSESPAKRDGARRARLLSVALAVVALAALAAGGSLLVSGRDSAPATAEYSAPAGAGPATAEDGLPGSLAGLPRVDLVTGERAVADVTALHGLDIPVVSAAIARYGESGDKAEVWVSYSEDAAAATKLAERMAGKIAEGRSPFDVPELVGGKSGIWFTRGMGQIHFFFARGTAVWWLSIGDARAQDALAEVLRVANG
ncbi:MAG: hypothetical protein HY775_04970 [Acidobacteria bacterium]|nr:hypothetical protein [Acidobacteriota bacterium]